MLDIFRRRFDTLGAESVVQRLEHYLSSVGECVCGGLLSTAWTRPADAGVTAFITGRLSLSEAIQCPRETRCYPAITLSEMWIERDALVSLLRAVLGPEKSHVLPEQFRASGVEHIYTSSAHESHSHWAETHLELTSRAGRTDPEWLPAVAPNLPPFQTCAEAVSTWVFDRAVTYATDLPHAGQLLVLMPDTRMRASKISPGANGIRLDLELRDSLDAAQACELQYVYSRSRSRLAVDTVKIEQARSIEIPFCPDATQLDVFCLHPNDGFVSHRAYSWVELQQAGANAQADDREHLKDIADGEREVVEFKPFLLKGHPKNKELVKTVIAFANTHGGRVYVGIRDDGEPEGRDGLKSFRSSGDPDGVPTQLAQLRKLIGDSVKPVPQVTLGCCEIAGEPVVIVEVPEGDAVFATHENDIFIRKGSTNRKPDPVTELAPLLALRGGASSSSAPFDDIV